jgi:ATP-dependent DNA helicase RecG
MGIKEKFNLEIKKEVTKTFLKTVSAYANYNDGEIIFGIDDNGDLAGIENVDDECLRIEQLINDSIEPTPGFYIEVEKVDDKTIIIVN